MAIFLPIGILWMLKAGKNAMENIEVIKCETSNKARVSLTNVQNVKVIDEEKEKINKELEMASPEEI